MEENMAGSALLAFASPATPEQEQQFNDWYDTIHIPQVREVLPDVTSVTRYRLVDPNGTDSGARFLAIYEMGGDDVAAAAGAMGAAVQNGQLDTTPAMDVTARPPELLWVQRSI
jgi:hypothetical protein